MKSYCLGLGLNLSDKLSRLNHWPHDDADDAHNDLVQLREELKHDTCALSHQSDDDAERDAEDEHTCTTRRLINAHLNDVSIQNPGARFDYLLN